MTLIALNRINKGESVNQVASDINVGWLTVLGWKDYKWYWVVLCEETYYWICWRKEEHKSSEYKNVSEALYQWFRIQMGLYQDLYWKRRHYGFITSSKKKKESLDVLQVLGGYWLDRWKQHYGVKLLSICRRNCWRNQLAYVILS